MGERIMAGLQIHQEELSGRVTLRLEGTLDWRTAMQLRHSLEGLGTHEEVVLDFTHLREFKDTAVGVLTGELTARKVQLRGLAGHHERMFRYFGVTTGTTPRAYYTPEEVLA
jgi:anti-anti-sigma regulatory factor